MAGLTLDDLPLNYEKIWSETIESYEGRPLRLLDIEGLTNNKLIFVPAKPGLDYCALSYTWMGNGNQNSPHLFERLSPFTVDGLKHAAKTCHTLGHRYMWLDALCINQTNDEENKEKQREI